MNPILVVECVALLLLFCLSAFFSSAETAFFSLNPVQIHRLRRTRPQAARRVERFVVMPTQFLSTVLIGNTLVNIAAANLGFLIADSLFPGAGETISIPTMTLLVLIFGEVTPKRLAVRRAERLTLFYLPFIEFAVRLLAPARAVLDRITRSFETHIRRRPRSMTEEEFLTAFDFGHEEGVLNKEELAMVDGIVRMESLRASDVMTPRVDLIGIDLDEPAQNHVDTARKARLRYLPVYRDTPDHVVGFLDVFRFLRSADHDIQSAMVPPFYLPETAPLDTILTTFQQERIHLAVVIDEFGGTAGLITRGDVLEEIVQDVENEFGEERPKIEPQGRNRWLVDGSTSLEDINHELDLELEAEGADRIAGWISAHTERVPRPGDAVEAQECRATVLEVRRQRVRTVLLEKT